MKPSYCFRFAIRGSLILTLIMVGYPFGPTGAFTSTVLVAARPTPKTEPFLFSPAQPSSKSSPRVPFPTKSRSHPPQRTVTDRIGRTLTLPLHGPHRVIPMVPSMAATLSWLGVSNRVIGVTEFTDDLTEYAGVPRVGGPFTPNIEQIVQLQPDLVILARDHNPRSLAETLDRVGIPYLVVRESNLDDMLQNLELLGRVFNRQEKVNRWIKKFREFTTCLSNVHWHARPRVLLILSIKPVFTTGKDAFITRILQLAGYEVVSAGIKKPWPQVSIEQIVQWDPEALMLTRTHAQRVLPILRHHPAWRAVRAVRENHFFILDDMILRPTPYLAMMISRLIRLSHAPKEGLNCMKEWSRP